MANSDSGDYELVSRQEIEELRREINSLKKNNLSEGDKAKVLIESMDRLTISVNRMITILDDAQADIIDEYQQSKPTEKLNKLLEQNNIIARALVAINDSVSGPPREVSMPNKSNSGASTNTQSNSTQQSISESQSNPRSMFPVSGQDNVQDNNVQSNQQNSNMPTQNNGSFTPNMNNMANQNMRGNTPTMSMSEDYANNPMSFHPPTMPKLEDMPPLGMMPPLDMSPPNIPKKKFLGIM